MLGRKHCFSLVSVFFVSCGYLPSFGTAVAADLVRFETELPQPWNKLPAREDGVQAFRAGTAFLMIRPFFTGDQTAMQRVKDEAKRVEGRGQEIVKPPGKVKFAERTWAQVRYQSEAESMSFIQSVTNYGPALIDVFLAAPSAQIDTTWKEVVWSFENLEFGALANMSADLFEPPATSDLVGTWDLIALETTGNTVESDPWYFANQRFIFSAEGDYRFIASEKPITKKKQKSVTRSAAKAKFSINAKNFLEISREGTTRKEFYGCWRVVRDQEPLQKGDLVWMFLGGQKTPLMVKVLRRKAAEESSVLREAAEQQQKKNDEGRLTHSE